MCVCGAKKLIDFECFAKSLFSLAVVAYNLFMHIAYVCCACAYTLWRCHHRALQQMRVRRCWVARAHVQGKSYKHIMRRIIIINEYKRQKYRGVCGAPPRLCTSELRSKLFFLFYVYYLSIVYIR